MDLWQRPMSLVSSGYRYFTDFNWSHETISNYCGNWSQLITQNPGTLAMGIQSPGNQNSEAQKLVLKIGGMEEKKEMMQCKMTY